MTAPARQSPFPLRNSNGVTWAQANAGRQRARAVPAPLEPYRGPSAWSVIAAGLRSRNALVIVLLPAFVVGVWMAASLFSGA